MFAKTVNGSVEKLPYTESDLRRDNPQVSFPSRIPLQVWLDHSAVPVKTTPPPTVDRKTHSLQFSAEKQGLEWVQVWTTDPLPLDQAAGYVRLHRDMLLGKTDWRAMSDNTLSANWATYRQALRDITEQEGFPYSVEWPVEPE